MSLKVVIDKAIDGYSAYRIIDEKGKELFKSSAPAFLVWDLAHTKCHFIELERAKK